MLICLHDDDTLERMSNIAKVFPNRPSPNVPGRGPDKRWLANDFTLEEIRRLDAAPGSTRNSPGSVSRVPGNDRRRSCGKAGLYPELKSPLYTARGVDMEQIFVPAIQQNGLDKPEAVKTTPVIIQSFDETTIRRVARDLPRV